MIQIPSDIQVNSFYRSLRQGFLFRMKGDEPFLSDEYHIFIVLNYDPHTHEALILVNGTSQVQKRLRYYHSNPQRRADQAIIIFEAGKYPFFPKKTLIDCNSVTTCCINSTHFVNGDLQPMSERLSDEDLQRIIEGVMNSRTIPPYIKNKIQPQE